MNMVNATPKSSTSRNPRRPARAHPRPGYYITSSGSISATRVSAHHNSSKPRRPVRARAPSARLLETRGVSVRGMSVRGVTVRKTVRVRGEG